MKIGDKLLLPAGSGDSYSKKKVLKLGEVVYIHPKGNFFTAEFVADHKGHITKYRESYPIDKSRFTSQRRMRCAAGVIGGKGHRR